MKKKHLLNAKKTLSVFLTVLMIMSAWVFFPGMVTFEAEAKATMDTYRKEQDKYGTPCWDGKETYYSTWKSGSTYTKFTWPKHIYLDMSETLESAGYYYTVEWDYGDGTDYRIVNNGFIFGGWRMQNSSQWPANYNTMNRMFNNYDLEASTHGTQDGIDGGSSTDFDLKIGNDNWDGAQVIIWRNPKNDNSAQHQYVFMKGRPAGIGVGRYSTSGAKPNSFGGWQYWSNGWKNASDKYTNSNDSGNWTTDCYEGTWKEVAFDITIYDKTALGNAITAADNMLLQTDKYSRAYLAKLQTARNTASAALIKRVTDQTEIDNAKNALQAVINAPEMRSYDVTFENIFSITDWYYSDSSSYNSSNGIIEVENNNAIKLYKSEVTEFTTQVSYETHNNSMYSMPVTGGKSYTVSFETTSSAGGSIPYSNVYLFWYDVNGGSVKVNGSEYYSYASFSTNGVHSATFTAPTGATQAEIRFGNDIVGSGTTIRFINVAVYPADRGTTYDIENWTTRPYTKVYAYDAPLDTSLPVPTRTGYDFNGWYIDANNDGIKSDGEAVTDATGNVTKSLTMTQHYNLYADWAPRTMDVGYDNLFSLSDWALTNSTASSNASRGEVKYDLDKGTITVNTTKDGEVYSNYSSAADHYQIPVEANKEYIFKADVALEGGDNKQGQMFVFFYDANGNGLPGSLVNGAVQEAPHIGLYIVKEGANNITFTTPSGCTKMSIRVGATTVGTTATYSNIGFYEKADYDDYAKDYAKVREPFKIGETKSLFGPTREGWVFDGWTLEDGTKIENTSGLTASTTVYANWTKLRKVTFLNGAQGTTITTIEVKDGEKLGTLPATTPTKDSDDDNSYEFDYWYGNSAKLDENTVINADITVFPVFRTIPHTFVWAANPHKQATCDEPASVEKLCSGCGYSLGNVPYDGENANWLAKGHSYTGGILDNSSTGNTDNDTHSIKCTRYSACGTVQLVKHEWSGDVSQGATCTTPGTVKKTCPCGAEKFVDGEIDPNEHNFDLTDGTSNGDKATHTVNCTYNPEHTETVNCTDDNDDCKCDICEQELVHAYDQQTTTYVKTPAACTTDAVYYYTCKCGKQGTETWTDEGSAKGHTWKDEGTDLYSAADCEHDAVYWQTCEACGISANNDTTGSGGKWTAADTKLGHDYTDYDKYNSDNNGKHQFLCKNGCDTYGFNGVKGAYTDCTYGEWDNTVAENHSKTCTVCSYIYSEDHDWTAWTSTDADKESEGQHTRSCEVCGRVETENCTYTSVETKENCTEDGYTTHTCNICKHEYVTAGATKTGHDYTGEAQDLGNGTHNFLCKNGCNTYGFEAVRDAYTTCTYDYDNTDAGEHKATCKECEYTFTEKCSGGQATCTDPATCEKCETAYGNTAPHSFTGTPVQLDGDFHAYLCEYCSTPGLSGVGANEGGKETCSGGTATCSALAVCDVCKDTHGELKADAHKWGAWTNIEGTETHTRVCEYDEKHTQTSTCESSGQAIIPADCETEGYTLNTCDFCNHQWETNPVAALDHDWSDWVSDDAGKHTKVCERYGCTYGADGEAKTETADCTKENAASKVTAPTCLEQGYTTYTCNDCGYKWDADYTDPTGHSYEKQTKKTDAKYLRTSKDCTTDWTYWYCCDNCDVSAETEKDKYQDITVLYWVREEAAGHNFTAKTATEDYIATPATCTAKATYYYSCSVCGTSSEDTESAKTFESGNALGHGWENTETFKKSDSDCINNEVYYKECSRCHISSKDVTDETWEKEDTKSGHDFDYEGGYTAGTAANCTTDGVKEHWTCETCGKHYADEEGTTEIAADKLVIAALKHDYKDISAKAATCEEDGYTKHKQCQREGCDYRNSDYEVIPATGHDFDSENGYYCDTIFNYHAYKCTNCEAYGVDDVKWTVETDEDDVTTIKGGVPCTFTGEYVNYEDENGIHSHKLTCVCGNVQGDVCADEDGAEYTEPECGVNGFDTYVCTVCGYEWTVERENTALQHNFGTEDDWTQVNGKNEHIRYCKNGCGESETEACYTENPLTGCGVQNVCDACGGNFGEFTEHAWAEIENDDYLKDAATCTTNAVYYKVCSNPDCGEVSAEHTWEKAGSKLGHDMTDYIYSVDGWKNIPEGFDKASIKEATCCTEGKSISYCTRCDEYKTRAVKADPNKHQWEKDEASEDGLLWIPGEGDCSTGIIMTNKCSVEGCGKVQTKVEYNVEHDYEIIYEELPTCKAEGSRHKKCTRCGEQLHEYYNQETGLPEDLAPTGIHSYVEISATPATCTKNAYVTKQCKVCYETIIEETEGSIVPHNYVDYKEAAPSCEADGHSAYQKCADCGTEEGKTVYEATGHIDADGNGKCEECNRVLFETDDGEKSCGCICHKDNFLMKIIYKILNFFWKLFKISKSCNCGNVHW